MKKLLLTLCLIVTSAALFAQARFMGIEMGTPFSTFKQELLKKGFTYLGTEDEYDNLHNFYGTFRGKKREVYVVTSGENVVWKAGVILDTCVRNHDRAYSYYDYGNPDDMKKQFDEFNEALTEKYGAPNIQNSNRPNMLYYSGWIIDGMGVELIYYKDILNVTTYQSATFYRLVLNYFALDETLRHKEHLNDDL